MKTLNLICEAKLNLNEKAESGESSGLIEARITTWGAREGADGRKFFYKPEGFMQWASEFAKMGRPLPMYVNHNSDAIPVGEWTSFEMDDDGMNACGRLYVNTTAGSDLYQVMKESPNMFGGVSVGAYAEEYQWVKEDGTPMTIGSDDPYESGYFQITKGGLRDAQQATAAKAFGGSRAGVQSALTNEAAMREAARTASDLRYRGFNTAAELAKAARSMNMQGYQNAMNLGLTRQQYAQLALDAQRNLPLQQLAIQQAAMGAQPANLVLLLVCVQGFQ